MHGTFVQSVLPAATVALLSVGCAHSGDKPPPVFPAPAEYRLGLEDVVDVQVWKEPALSAIVPVRPDGRITVPMVGEVQAQGRTAPEIQAEIREKLKPYVPAPSVTVIVREVKAGRFYVLGEVAHPGAFPLSGHITVVEALALAGGTTEFASTGRMVVLRPRGAGQPSARIRVNLRDLVGGRVPPLVLLTGDTVYVP